MERNDIWDDVEVPGEQDEERGYSFVKPVRLESLDDIPPMIVSDTLELSFTPLLRWRDALLRVFGVAMPKQMLAVVTVKRIEVLDGYPSVTLSCQIKENVRSVLMETNQD